MDKECHRGRTPKTKTECWRELEFIPRAIVHSTNQTAAPEDPMGMFGVTVTVLPHKSGHETRYVDKEPNVDLSQIHTPMTMSDEEF